MEDSITLKQFQKSVDEWIEKYGVRYFDVKTNMILLVEEVGELARLIAREYGEQSFKKDESDIHKSIENEMGDILFVLTCLANQMDMNWEEIVRANMEKKTTRDFDRHINNPKLDQ